MIKINAIPLDYEPRKKIFPKLPYHLSAESHSEPEMSEFESAFLCGTIKQFRPKKILEVGIAGGATTAIILQALEDLDAPYEMYSVDASETFYRDQTKPSGFMAEFVIENNLFAPPHSTLSGTHKFYRGNFLPQVIDEIGGDIDFVILDTIHKMPGEGLDFLAVLPYLTTNAVIVLHDVSWNQSNVKYFYLDATCVLFSAVAAEKYVNFVFGDPKSKFLYPNIAAFQINEQTIYNIENVFLTMILRWSYLPSKGELALYLNHYQKFYPTEMCKIFLEAITMNAFNLHLAQRK